MQTKTGIWLVRAEAEALGELLARSLDGKIVRPWQLFGKTGRERFAEIFRDYTRWVLVMASGIAVRYLQGLPDDKRIDPAVVVVDEGARFAISLLSGHEGGANILAYRVANATGAVPVITTAAESKKNLILGVGCRKGIEANRIHEAANAALEEIGESLANVREVATIDLKMEEPGLLEWCERNELPLRSISKTLIENRPWVAKPSDWVREKIGVDGVCEPSALLASVRGKLVLEKMKLNGVAVAIVEDR